VYGRNLIFDGSYQLRRTLFDYPNCKQLTVLCWVRIARNSLFFAENPIVQIKGNNGVDNYTLGVTGDGDLYMFLFRRTNNAQFITTEGLGLPRLDDGQWHSLCWQVDNTDNTKVKYTMRIDNTGVTIGDVNAPTVNVAPNLIGSGNNSNIFVGANFEGELDELMIWDRILRPASITAALANPNSIANGLCVTQTPTPSQTGTPTKTPTPTRTPAPSVEPLITRTTGVKPATCNTTGRQFCPGVRCTTSIVSHGIYRGQAPTYSDMFILLDIAQLQTGTRGLPYGTEAGRIAISQGSYTYGANSTYTLTTMRTYAMALRNSFHSTQPSAPVNFIWSAFQLCDPAFYP
jgi:hypothetical protein